MGNRRYEIMFCVSFVLRFSWVPGPTGANLSPTWDLDAWSRTLATVPTVETRGIGQRNIGCMPSNLQISDRPSVNMHDTDNRLSTACHPCVVTRCPVTWMVAVVTQHVRDEINFISPFSHHTATLLAYRLFSSISPLCRNFPTVFISLLETLKWKEFILCK